MPPEGLCSFLAHPNGWWALNGEQYEGLLTWNNGGGGRSSVMYRNGLSVTSSKMVQKLQLDLSKLKQCNV